MTSTSIGTRLPPGKTPGQGSQLPLFPERRRGRRPRGGAGASSSLFPPEPQPHEYFGPRHRLLGNTQNKFPRLGPDAVARGQRRAKRRRMRDVLWHRSSIDRCRQCGRATIGGDVSMIDNAGVSHYRGLVTCGSIWACPVCSAKIRNARAQEIAAAAASWHQAGNTVLMVTLTAPHDLGMPLADLLPVIAKGFTSVIAGRAWLRLKDRIRIAGQIRSVEVTHGPNGWHPHLHVLVFIDGQAGAEHLALLGVHVRSKWRRFIVRAGYRPPSDLHGVKIDVCTSAAEAGLYIAKTQDGKSPGNEMARADLKSGRAGHRTPFELLGEIADTGDLAGLPLWHEYEKATKRHQAITWSKGLRKLLLGLEPERTDEEIAADEVGGDLVLEISREAWREVTRHLGLETRLLEAFEVGGPDQVVALAAHYGLVPDPDPPGPVPRLITRV